MSLMAAPEPVAIGSGVSVSDISPASLEKWANTTCGTGSGFMVWTECEDGHGVAMELVCHKDWCLDCGTYGSRHHLRMFARWLPRIQQFSSMGYFVPELPLSVRRQYRSKQDWSRASKAFADILKAHGFLRSLRTWHFFGDYFGLMSGRAVDLDRLQEAVDYAPDFGRLCASFASGGGRDLVVAPNRKALYWSSLPGFVVLVEDFAKAHGLRVLPYTSIELHFHGNYLVEGRFIQPHELESIKRDWASFLGVDQAPVNYLYRQTPSEMVHTLMYVTRPTFLDAHWDFEMAKEKRRFRNAVVMGRGLWTEEAKWSLDDLDGEARKPVEGLDVRAINLVCVEHRCPVEGCGKPLKKWSKCLPDGILHQVDRKPVGAGISLLPVVPRPPPVKDDLDLVDAQLGALVEEKIAREREAVIFYSELWAPETEARALRVKQALDQARRAHALRVEVDSQRGMLN